jgi:hypothetical protein
MDPRDFWTWFAAREEQYRSLDAGRADGLLDALEERLSACAPGLWFEIGGRREGPRELILTAGGDPRLFEDVRRLVAAAPALPAWRVIAFKPPQGFAFVATCDGVRIDPRELWYQPLEAERHPELLGLLITGPGYSDEAHSRFKHACRVVLDTALGEVVAAEEIHYVEVGALPRDPAAEGFLALPELAEFVASRRRRRGQDGPWQAR